MSESSAGMRGLRGRGTQRLQLDDIADSRAYEREREEFRKKIIELKRRRRVGVGPFVTFVFENRDTIRFQIQEMARVEKLISDEAIQTELATYNPLIPEPGQLSATMFIELTNEQDLREWLPKLVGVEREVELRVGDEPYVVRAAVEDAHAAHLTRDEITASVHYVHFEVGADRADEFEAGPVILAVTHPAYEHETELSDDTRAELAADLRGGP